MRAVSLVSVSVLLCLICISLQAEGLDKKFYNNYLNSLNKESEKEKNLNGNLLRASKEAIRRNDRENGQSYAQKMGPESIRYELLDQDGPYARGIFKELEVFRPAKYIYIVESKPYLILLSYSVSPERSLYVEPVQNYVLKSKDPKENQTGESEHGS